MSDDFDWTPFLEEGEEVLWQGRPDGKFRLFMSGADIMIVPTFGFVGVFPILTYFSEAYAQTETIGPSTTGAAAALAAIYLFVLYVLIGRPLIDMFSRRATHYAVTNLRLLSAHHRLGIIMRKKITRHLLMDVALGRFSTIRFDSAVKRADVPNNVLIAMMLVYFRLSRAVLVGYVSPCPEFRRISEGKEVSRLLKSLKASAKLSAS